MKNNVSFNSELAKFGIGLFETIKVTNYPLDLDLHINRLYNSAKELNLNINKEKEFYKKTYNEDTYKKGFSLCISPIKRGNSIIYRHKTTNYYESIYSKHYATDRGFDDAIFLDSFSNILECSMSNIFFIKQNTLYTPKKTSPLLNGIMKLNIETICKKLNINLVECDINISSIDEFESVFVTNSLMGIMPVTNIEKNNYNKENKLIKILKENL